MLANLNQAMDYIEEHLTEEVSFDELAKRQGFLFTILNELFVYCGDESG